MSNIKERLLGAITVMTDEQALALWNRIALEYVPEVEPDKWDLKMLEDIKNDPECREFLTEEEARKIIDGAE